MDNNTTASPASRLTPHASAWRLLPNRWDFLAFPLIISLIAMLAVGYHESMAPLVTLKSHPITLEPANLPGYALRTTLRMLAGMVASLAFTLVYGTLAAKSRRAAKVLVPALAIGASAWLHLVYGDVFSGNVSRAGAGGRAGCYFCYFHQSGMEYDV